jgi:hypothetical protein
VATVLMRHSTGCPAQAQRHAPHLQHRLAHRHAQHTRGVAVGPHRAQPFVGAHDGDAELGLVQVVDGAGPFAPALLGQPAEQRGRQHQPVVHHRPALQAQAVLDLQRRLTGLHRQRRGGVVVQPRALEAQQLDRGCLAQPVAALDMEELEQEAVAGVRGDEGAPALPAHQDVVGHQVVDRAPQRAHRHAEAGDSSASLGSASPGATTPSSMARSSERLTARNSGMPAASGAMVASADSGAGARRRPAGGWHAPF